MKNKILLLSLLVCISAVNIVNAEADQNKSCNYASCCKQKSCAPTPISKPTTITQSGCYCLTQDICGQITIAADNVTLDLNCHEVNGNGADSAIAADGHYNVTVKNGTVSNFLVIKNRGVGVAPNRCGVAISNGVDIELHDLNVISTDPVGVTLLNCVGLNISGCDFSNNNRALSLTGCRNGKVSCCAVYDNVNNNENLEISAIVLVEFCDCIELVDVDICNNKNNASDVFGDINIFCLCFSSNISLERCKVNGNGTDRPFVEFFHITRFLFSENCTMTDCQTNNNSIQDGISFLILQANFAPRLVVRRSQVNGNTGAALLSCMDIFISPECVFEECQSNNNSARGDVVGYLLIISPECVVKNCQANGNTSEENNFGFGIEFCEDCIISGCQANNNSGFSTVAGFFNISEIGSIMMTDCQANNNFSQGQPGSFNDGSVVGIRFVSYPGGVVVENCEANNNSCVDKQAAGIAVVPFLDFGSSAANNVRIVNCVTNGNNSTNDQAFGVLLDGTLGGANNVVIKCCQAYDTVSSSTITGQLAAGIGVRNGARDVSIQDCQVYDSQASGNGDAAGISVADTLRCTIEGSEANNSTAANGTGIGIVLSGTTDNSTVKDSTAIGNQTDGFADFGIPNNFFAGNYAENNGILDYNGVTAVAVDFDKSTGVFGATPNRWSNIRALP